MVIGSSVQSTSSYSVVNGSREEYLVSRLDIPGRKRVRRDNFKFVVVDSQGGKRDRPICDRTVGLTLNGKVLPSGTELRYFFGNKALV